MRCGQRCCRFLGRRGNRFNDRINEARLLGLGQTFDANQDHGHAFFAPLLRREFFTIPAKVRLTSISK